MNPDAHLTCYEILDASFGEQVVVVKNQFTEQNLEVEDPELLCVPNILNKIVFVTGLAFSGNLGGLSGADDKCNAAASAASLPGTYTAWLSDSGNDAKDRVTQSAAPYVRTDGVRVADDFADLINCGNPFCLRDLLNRDEFNSSIGFLRVWTGTQFNGKVFTGGRHCMDWLTMSNFELGGFGNAGGLVGFWTDDGATNCGNALWSPPWKRKHLNKRRGAAVVAGMCPVTNVPGSVACCRTALGWALSPVAQPSELSCQEK